MADLLKTGLAWLGGVRKAQMAHAITYRRGDAEVVLQATVGKSEFEAADAYGRVTEIESRDYLITAADLVLNVLTEPKADDEIVETLAGVAQVFRVMAPGTEPVFRYSDQSRLTLRVHTKYVGPDS